MKSLLKSLLAAAIACSAMHSSPSLVSASDHLDAPNLTGNGQQDINDLYAFKPSADSDNSVLILTVNPFAGNMSPTAFGTDTSYRFEIDNTGDAMSNLAYEATFSNTASGQNFNLTLNGTSVASGAVGSSQSTSNGGTVQTGVFDDPFFFDLGILDGSSTGGTDTFAGANVSAIVLEVPTATLLANDSSIGVWATTSQGGSQVDRVGRPAINTVLLGDASKQAFNEASPDGDFNEFGAEVSENIAGLSNQDNADTLTPVLLPDTLRFDTSSTGGFLNGRRLEDDVIDLALQTLTTDMTQTDGVGANDVGFNSVFPFLGDAQPQAVPEPSSAVAIALAFGTCLVRRRRKS